MQTHKQLHKYTNIRTHVHTYECAHNPVYMYTILQACESKDPKRYKVINIQMYEHTVVQTNNKHIYECTSMSMWKLTHSLIDNYATHIQIYK